MSSSASSAPYSSVLCVMATPFTSQAYTTMIRACVRSGDVERALSFMDEMIEMGVQPTVVTYNTVLMAAGEAPLW